MQQTTKIKKYAEKESKLHLAFMRYFAVYFCGTEMFYVVFNLRVVLFLFQVPYNNCDYR